MWLRIDNLNAKVTRRDDSERSWLQDYLTFTDSSARFRRGGGKSSDKVSMFNMLTEQFPSGLVPVVRKAATDAGIPIEVADVRTPAVPYAHADLSWLRDYQLEAVQAVLSKERGILWCPTGSGKTEIAVGLVNEVPTTWLFLVHRSNLMVQTAERYELRTGCRAAVVGDNVWDREAGVLPLTVATFQTLNAALSDRKDNGRREKAKALLAGVGGVIVDESHTLPADSFWRIVMMTGNARYRVGLSGTPLARGDRRSLLSIAALGPVIYRIRAERLINEGVLAKPTIRLIEVKQQSNRPTWQGVYGESIVRSTTRNRAVVDAALRAKKPAFLFVKEIKHGRLLEKELARVGLRTSFVWGQQPTEWRQRHVRDLVRDRIDVLICSVVFQEGVDVPELRSVIVASAGKSVIATLQRLGRGTRVERDASGAVVPGGDQLEVWDFADLGCGCSQDSEEGKHRGCQWLEKHTKARIRAYTSEGYQTSTEQSTFVETIASVRKT